MDVVAFQSEYVDKLSQAAKAAVFNSDSFSNKQIQDTATGKNLDRDNVQDTLYSCAIGFADAWRFLVQISASFTQLDKGLSARLVFNKDFKLKGLSELVLDLEAAKRSEAGASVIQNIQEDAARLMYADNPEMFRRWQIKESLNPFSGYTNEMILTALSGSEVPERYKVRYFMLGVLFDEIEIETPNFYQMPYAEQVRIVEEKVKMYMAETAAAAPKMQIPIA